MFLNNQKITIIRVPRPSNRTINTDLQWLGTSLGMINLRDKDKSCFRIFIELLKASKTHTMLSSDELALKLNLSRGTVIHHLTKLINSGIAISYKNRYQLRVTDLSALIEEIERDLLQTLEELKKTALNIDEKLLAER